MGNGAGKLNMAHAFTTHLGQRNFNTALFADNTAEFHPLVFAAKAFIVLDRTKNTRAEQAIPFWLERTIVDGLGLLDFAIRPGTDLFGRCQLNLDLIKRHRLAGLAKNFHELIHVPKPPAGNGEPRFLPRPPL